ncbi:MAG: ATP-binding protein [Chitinophagales bacterium]|nr:ATP-binding protein [Chitinophagales bacterium]
MPFKRFSIENFKVFDSYQSFEFKRITLLTGQNSSGKSSLIEALNILANNKDIEVIRLNELAQKIGNFENVISKGSSSGIFLISYDIRSDYIDETLTVSISYKINKKNKQQADIYRYKVEDVDEVIIDLELDVDDKDCSVNGYVNFPYLWDLFFDSYKKQKKELEKIPGDIRRDYYESPPDNTKLINNYFSKKNEVDFDFFNSVTEKDFADLPIFNIGRIANSSRDFRKGVYDTFFQKYNPEISELIKWQKEIYDSFVFSKVEYFDELFLRHIIELICYDPFQLLQDKSEDGFPDKSDKNPLQLLLAQKKYKTDLWTVMNFKLEDYFVFKGIPQKDLETLFSNTSKDNYYPRYSFGLGAHINPNISQDAKKIIAEIDRKERLRKHFEGFLREILLSTIRNVLPESTLFIPANRSKQKIAIQNLGSGFNYENFLQETAVKYLELDKIRRDEIDDHIGQIVKIFGFGDKVEIKSGKLLEIIVKKKGNEFNITEEGFGISQLFSIILGICVNAIEKVTIGYLLEPEYVRDPKLDVFVQPTLVFIEEPESNIHPSFQSRLADAFIYLSKKLNVQFIVETHSEYLVRRLRYLVHLWYKDDKKGLESGIPKEYWNAYYFNKKENTTFENPQIFEIYVSDEDGFLNRQFGEGFLDISTSLEIENLDLFQNKKRMN